jgi:hypothetical protein
MKSQVIERVTELILYKIEKKIFRTTLVSLTESSPSRQRLCLTRRQGQGWSGFRQPHEVQQQVI